MTPTTAEKGKTIEPAKTGTTQPATVYTQAPTLAMQSKNIVDIVEARVQQFIKSGQLDMPKDYSVDNAMKSAWLALQATEDKDHNKALLVCTRDSVANSLLDMVVQGLNVGKKQGYFIVYGKTLTFQRSYFGAMAVAQMVNPKIAEFTYAVVYEGDTFKYGIEKGKKAIHTHEQTLENVDKKKIKAAYCVILDKDGNNMKTEIMTVDEIHQAWKQSKMNPFDEKGNVKDSSTHGKFAADMCLRTVINKTCKTIINASSDNALLLERINRNEELSDIAEVTAEIEEHANTGVVLQITEGPEPDPATGELDATNEKMADLLKETGICVCGEMISQQLAAWDCPVHGRYKGGKFSPSPAQPGPAEPAKKGPGF